jgi:glycolate oxidase FAD binding subunit
VTEPWAGLVGAAHVRPGGAADAVDGLVPACVVRPGSAAEVAACVGAAAAAGASLVATGLGGHTALGAPPRRLDVLLRLDRLDRIVDHQPGDMTVTVEAGCPLPALEAALARDGQWLPLDPPRPEATTAGGAIAANLCGPLRASQGTVRDLLLGLVVAGGDGALVRSGGRVVKNVAGYDLSKLHVGALGTVGIVVEATFKVRPRPACEAAVIVPCAGAALAAEAALAAMGGAVPPLWLEVAGPGVLAETDGAAVAVGFGGVAEEVRAGAGAVRGIAGTRGRDAVEVADGAALRARLGAFPAAPAAAVLRAATLPAEVGRVLEAAEAAAAGAGARVRCLAHAAAGVVRVAVADAAGVAPLVRALRPALEAGGGSLVVERASADAKRGLDVWGDVGPGLPLMRALKAAFDPAAVLAPGRFVGGL